MEKSHTDSGNESTAFGGWSQPVLLVGGGRMGQALANGWARGGFPLSSLCLIEPAASLRQTFEAKGIKAFASLSEFQQGAGGFSPAILLFAVKPQVLGSLLPSYAAAFEKQANLLVVSIAAGIRLESFEKAFSPGQPLIRVMPNTPAAIGEGISALFASASASQSQKSQTESLMAALGKTLWLEDEAQMDAVTALSGSGPAYCFYMIECLRQAGLSLGLPPETAETLALETLAGAGNLARQSCKSPEVLRKEVTSPGGTTEAALAILMEKEKGLAFLMENAVRAACERSKELSGD